MKKYLLLLIFGLLLNVQYVLGQGATTSSMSGTVLDVEGGSIPGATILAIHQPSGTRYGIISNVDGAFILPNMRVGGPYKLTISFVGYEDFTYENIYLQLGQTFEVNAKLSESTTTLETVEVTATTGDIFDGNRTGSETNISEEAITNMPTASRGVFDYVRLTPQANLATNGDVESISIAGQNNRFNSIFIDGAVNNDVFGLAASGTNGGQTGVSPISPDAIEQFQVAVSPYDVSLGNFTGGSINAVTRSGTNDFSGSAYWFYRDADLAGQDPTDNLFPDDRRKLAGFTANTYGFRLGGPIVKDKLFFFVNAEFQRDEITSNFNPDTYQGNSTLADLENLRTFVSNTYGYDVGEFFSPVREREGDKFLVKFDYNASERSKFTLRYSYARAREIEAQPSTSTSVNFNGGVEVLPSITNSLAAEWSASFGSNKFNKLTIGYTTVRDNRGFVGRAFPRVTIIDNFSPFTTINFGSEPFSIGNVLNQDVLTLTNNFNIFKGKHTITIGTHMEYYDIYNLFLRQNYGDYTYVGINSFTSGGTPDNYERSYALLPGVDAQLGDNATDIAAEIQAAQLGFYIQDEFQVNNRLKLTGGLRIDLPFFLSDPQANEAFNSGALPSMLAEWGYDADEAKSGQVPGTQILFSPRFGFNYDILGDRTLQIRGGLGVFTGRIPFVWPGGSFTNNGVFVASIDVDDPLIGGNSLPFRADPFNQYTGPNIDGVTTDAPQVDLFAKDFKYPQVFRTSLAVDYKLPIGLVTSLEGIYTQNINFVRYRNINIARPRGFMNHPTDNRPIYGAFDASGRIATDFVDSRYERVLLADNISDGGYTFNLTASLRKPFSNGWQAGIAYTFGRSKVPFDATSSQNSSNWRNVEVADRNNLSLGFSDFDLGSRITIDASYRLDYGDFGATTLSLFYNGQSGRRFSYSYGRGSSSLPGRIRNPSGDDGSGRAFNDLIYIPTSLADANLVPVTIDGVTYTAEQQWVALDRFIESDPYLRNNRGKVSERNAGRLPFEHILDLKIMQDFYINVGDKRNTLQVSFDIFNFANLLNKNWGRRRFFEFDNFNLIEFAGYVDPQGGDYTPQYTFPFVVGDRIATGQRGNGEQGVNIRQRATIDDEGIYSSRWQMQIGVRYIFN